MTTTPEDSVSIARLAEALAHLSIRPSEDKQAVLRALGIAPDAFDNALSEWSHAIGADLANGRAVTLMSFANVYGKAERRAKLLRAKPLEIRSEVQDDNGRRAPTIVRKQLQPLASPRRSPVVPSPGPQEPTDKASYQLTDSALSPSGTDGARSLDETIGFVPPSAARRPVLPFAGATSAERLAELSKPDPAGEPSLPDPDATMMLPSAAVVPTAATGTFKDSLGGVAVAKLTVDEYAELHAALALAGAGDAQTLRRFGIASVAAYEALKQQFAQQFVRDGELRTKFLAATQEHLSRLKKSGSSGDGG